MAATIHLETHFPAPIDVVFDLARSIDLHADTFAHTGERAVAGCVRGLIGPGEEVTWEATHLGVRQRLTSRITGFERPTFFQDRQVRGAFAWFTHDHHFATAADGGTVMRDVFAFAAPLGPLGWLAERLVLTRYLTRLLTLRNRRMHDVLARGEHARYLACDAAAAGA